MNTVDLFFGAYDRGFADGRDSVPPPAAPRLEQAMTELCRLAAAAKYDRDRFLGWADIAYCAALADAADEDARPQH